MDKIIGIDHVGIGVKNMDGMKKFYQGILEFTEIFGEMPIDDHEPIHRLVRASPAIHSAIQMNQKCGGIFVDLFCHIYPKPRPIRKDFRYGDIGVSKTTIAVDDLNRFYETFKGRVNFCTQIHQVEIPEWGNYAFVYARDPEGNLIEFTDGEKLSIQYTFGGVRRIGISVTDLDRSIDFYKKHLGFDKMIVGIHENFSGNVDEISRRIQTKMRSCILGNSRGAGMVELFESIKPRGRSIPFCTNWGDYGYLQLCLLGNDIQDVEEYFLNEDLEMILNPQMISSDDPKNSGLSFLYIRDPDGIPVEVMVLPKEKN
jgi:catechol 2,3-dioxygenase-like lactoylglutathione lyase family enzyme